MGKQLAQYQSKSPIHHESAKLKVPFGRQGLVLSLAKNVSPHLSYKTHSEAILNPKTPSD